jgi:hypothetical protein
VYALPRSQFKFVNYTRRILMVKALSKVKLNTVHFIIEILSECVEKKSSTGRMCFLRLSLMTRLCSSNCYL